MFPKDLLDGFLQGNSSWTIKNFGLLYVPEKGGKIAIDASNYLRYKNIIAYETGRLLRMDNGQIVLGDSVIRD
ncbi:MAG: hypothetical protein LBH19_12605 [Dysgonamonadaceae bacterium]|nr:hypothetical protein [Dysgonamonadaceae bacterium]